MTYIFMVARPRSGGGAAFDAFSEKSRPVIDAYDGCVEGPEGAETSPVSQAESMVVRFRSIADARDFYESEDYAKLRGAPSQ